MKGFVYHDQPLVHDSSIFLNDDLLRPENDVDYQCSIESARPQPIERVITENNFGHQNPK